MPLVMVHAPSARTQKVCGGAAYYRCIRIRDRALLIEPGTCAVKRDGTAFREASGPENLHRESDPRSIDPLAGDVVVRRAARYGSYHEHCGRPSQIGVGQEGDVAPAEAR